MQHCFHSDETVSENVEVITTKDNENMEGAGANLTVSRSLSCQVWKLKCNSLEDLSRKLTVVENENLSQNVNNLNERIIDNYAG